jgi:hypothetical protein
VLLGGACSHRLSEKKESFACSLLLQHPRAPPTTHYTRTSPVLTFISYGSYLPSCSQHAAPRKYEPPSPVTTEWRPHDSSTHRLRLTQQPVQAVRSVHPGGAVVPIAWRRLPSVSSADIAPMSSIRPCGVSEVKSPVKATAHTQVITKTSVRVIPGQYTAETEKASSWLCAGIVRGGLAPQSRSYTVPPKGNGIVLYSRRRHPVGERCNGEVSSSACFSCLPAL